MRDTELAGLREIVSHRKIKDEAVWRLSVTGRLSISKFIEIKTDKNASEICSV